MLDLRKVFFYLTTYPKIRKSFGAIIMLLGMPLALGSWWGLLPVIPMIAVIVWRLLEEEKFLVKNLDGYADYRNQVKYRLIPFIW